MERTVSFEKVSSGNAAERLLLPGTSHGASPRHGDNTPVRRCSRSITADPWKNLHGDKRDPSGSSCQDGDHLPFLPDRGRFAIFSLGFLSVAYCSLQSLINLLSSSIVMTNQHFELN